jgi:hypothetical protein
VTCAGGDITSIWLESNNLTGTIPSSLGSLTELTFLYINYNNLKGTIPSSLASLTKLATLYLDENALTGLVPPLPFKQFECVLDYPDDCTEPNCNHFKCPLPAGSEQCKAGGDAGVHCK